MLPSEIIDTLIRAYPDNLPPMCILGPSGVGKSDVVMEAGRRLGFTPYQEWTTISDPDLKKEVWERGLVLPFNLLIQNVVALHGLPYPAEDGYVDWLCPRELPFVGNDRWPDKGILFVDEFNTAPMSNQTVLYELTLYRKVGLNLLKPGWMVVLAGNRAEDRGEIHPTPGPLMNRLMITYFDVHVGEFIDWGTRNNVDERILSYIAFKSGNSMGMRTRLSENPGGRINGGNGKSEPINIANLWCYDEQKMDENWPTPRAWANGVNSLFKLGLLPDKRVGHGKDNDPRIELVAGMIGRTTAIDFISYLDVYSTLPGVEDVLNGRVPFPGINVPQKCFALSTVICAHVKERVDDTDTLKKFFRLICQKDFPVEYGYYMMKRLESTGVVDRAQETEDWDAFADKYKEYVI
jgi:hypothetical protein